MKRIIIEYVIFDKVMSNPTVECVYDGAETAMEEEVDFVIAIGRRLADGLGKGYCIAGSIGH